MLLPSGWERSGRGDREMEFRVLDLSWVHWSGHDDLFGEFRSLLGLARGVFDR